MHEQISKNRIMINRNMKKEFYCEVLSTSQDRKSKTYVISKKGRYYLKHNQLADDIPIAIIFKSMGYESDHFIASAVGNEEDFVAAIGPSMDESASLGVVSRADAIKYLIPKVRRKTFGTAVIRTSQEHDVLDFLSNSMICHILSPSGNMKMKAIYLGLMLKRCAMRLGEKIK
jgi:DNA-directed RNA polymerase III subunit RPC2